MKLLDSGGAQEAGLILWTKQFLKILAFLETFHEIKYSTYTPPAYTTPPTATQILTPASRSKGRRVRRPFLTICSERNNNLLGKRSYLPLVLKSYRPPSSSLASFWPVYTHLNENIYASDSDVVWTTKLRVWCEYITTPVLTSTSSSESSLSLSTTALDLTLFDMFQSQWISIACSLFSSRAPKGAL